MTFFFSEAGVLLVVFRAGEVERRVRDIKISTDDDWLGEFESF